MQRIYHHHDVPLTLVRSLRSNWPKYHLHLQQYAEDQEAGVLQQMHFVESVPYNGKFWCTFEADVALLLGLVHHPHIYTKLQEF